MLEGTLREWIMVSGNRVEVETKDKMKIRTGRSPDLFDALAAGLEGARRLGFKIDRLGGKVTLAKDIAWFSDLMEKERRLSRTARLDFD